MRANSFWNWLNRAFDTPRPRRRRPRAAYSVACESLERRAMLAAPDVVSFSLAEDTGTPGDGITTRAALVGSISEQITVDVQFNFDGDGVPDEYTYSEGDGQFYCDPTSELEYGTHTVAARTMVYDAEYEVSYSGWASVTYTLVRPEPPEVVELQFSNGQLTGSVSPVDSVDVQFDFDGDAVPDDYTYSESNGEFTYDWSESGYGTFTVSARTMMHDPIDYTPLYGAWVSVTFTIDAPPPPEVGSLSFSNGEITGVVADASSWSSLDVQFDFDGDGIADDFAYADSNGSFSYDTSSEFETGTHTVWVRAVAYEEEELRGEWVSLTFTI